MEVPYRVTVTNSDGSLFDVFDVVSVDEGLDYAEEIANSPLEPERPFTVAIYARDVETGEARERIEFATFTSERAAKCPECQRSNGPHYRGPCEH